MFAQGKRWETEKNPARKPQGEENDTQETLMEGDTTPDEKGEHEEMFRHRDRSSLVPKSRLKRRTRMGAGTTPWCAREKRLFASSTQKRIFVSAHPSRSIPEPENTGVVLDGDSLHPLRWIGRAEEDRQGLLVDSRVRWSTPERMSEVDDDHRRVVDALGLAA
jgi:hypothetical protein